MLGESITYQEFANSIDTTEYNFLTYYQFQFDIATAKIKIICFMPPGQREVLGVRSRGAAKTWDEMVFDLWLAQLRDPYTLLPDIRKKLPWEAPLRGYWFSTSEDQLDQPKEYFDYIISHSFLRFITKKKTNTLVRFKHGGKLKLSILTKKKVRSGRGDFITIDEEAQAEEELYNACVGIISGSLFGFLSHISTPCKATIFEKNHDKLKKREYTVELQLIFKVPWWDAPFLARNKGFYEEEERTNPRWWYLQEYCAEFTLPMGAVFRNVEYDVYQLVNNEWILKYDLILSPIIVSGIDWNPVSGHWCVGGRWLENMQGFLVTHAVPIAVGYTHKLKEEAYLSIKKYAIHKKRLCIESGGINEEYVDWFKEWFGRDRAKRDVHVLYEDWDSANINKTNATLSMLDKTIYVDRMRFPELAKMIEDCQWDKDADTPKLKKDPVNSPHALDAFLHAVNKRLLKEQGLRRFDWYGST